MAICVLVYTATLSAAISTAADPADTAFRSLWSLSGHETVFRNFGALELVRIWVDGEWWRLLSTALLHGSLLHLVLNTWSLAAIGEHVEHTWGPARTLLLFITASLAGCLASLVWCESAMVVGASAGVLGQAGALWSARRFGSPELQHQLEDISDFRLGLLILLCLGLGVAIPGIAQAGHVGGLVMGTGLGWLWSKPRPVWQKATGAITAVALLLTLALLGRAPTWSANYHALLGLRAVDDQQIPTAVEHFKNSLDRDPENPTLLNDIAYKLALAGAELPWAESLAHRALAVEPDNGNYLDTLGWILCLQGQTDAGLTTIQQALATFEGDPPEEISQHVTTCPNAALNVPRETLGHP